MIAKSLPSTAPTETPPIVPRLLSRFLARIMGLPPGRAYAITLYIPEDTSSEPIWSIKDLGKIENQR